MWAWAPDYIDGLCFNGKLSTKPHSRVHVLRDIQMIETKVEVCVTTCSCALTDLVTIDAKSDKLLLDRPKPCVSYARRQIDPTIGIIYFRTAHSKISECVALCEEIISGARVEMKSFAVG